MDLLEIKKKLSLQKNNNIFMSNKTKFYNLINTFFIT